MAEPKRQLLCAICAEPLVDHLITEPCVDRVAGIEPDRPAAWAKEQYQGLREKGLKPCGTEAAYVRHRRNGEEACMACKGAHAARQRNRSNA